MMVAMTAFAVLLVLLTLNIPIAFAIGVSALAAIGVAPNVPVVVSAQRMFYGLDTFTLISVPLFILAGRLMALGGVTRDLLNLSRVFVGFLRGGLAYINIVASMIFAGITGTAASDTSSIGSILIPAMIDKGYEKDFTVAVTATSSTIGIMIPPSVPMVLYGVATNQSIGKLFIGGVVPGIMVGAALMAVTAVLARRRNYPREESFTFQAAAKICLRGVPAIMTVLIIIGGIVTGFFTPTEAAGIACVYTMLLGIFFYRELKWRDIPNILKEVAVTVGMVAMMISAASVLGWIFANQNIPRIIGEAILSITDNRIVIMLLVNALLLFVGTWMDLTPAVIVFAPILLPIATQVGIDPVHFGIIMVVNLAIGLFTPPVGVCLFIACGIAKISITDTLKAFIPFFVVMLFVLLLVTYIPPLCMTLPNLLG
ncbi:MAG: TRAP transporter large permease [Spirochaetales bacterium]|jgi:C4-dicarboxylate transporter DctM subunit|nr:TRAP transporter large permease [Spirochaetales bacterium]